MDAGSVQLHGFWKEPATRTTKRIVERITILSSRQKGRWTIMPEAIPLFLFSSFFFWLKHRRRQDKNAKLFFVCSGTPAAAACVQPAPIEQQQQAKKSAALAWHDPKTYTPLFFSDTLLQYLWACVCARWRIPEYLPLCQCQPKTRENVPLSRNDRPKGQPENEVSSSYSNGYSSNNTVDSSCLASRRYSRCE